MASAECAFLGQPLRAIPRKYKCFSFCGARTVSYTENSEIETTNGRLGALRSGEAGREATGGRYIPLQEASEQRVGSGLRCAQIHGKPSIREIMFSQESFKRRNDLFSISNFLDFPAVCHASRSCHRR